jgi:hypothetical protein
MTTVVCVSVGYTFQSQNRSPTARDEVDMSFMFGLGLLGDFSLSINSRHLRAVDTSYLYVLYMHIYICRKLSP